MHRREFLLGASAAAIAAAEAQAFAPTMLPSDVAGVLGLANIPALAQAFKASLLAGGSDKVLTLLGDSTGNGPDEHFYLLTLALESADPSHYIDYYLYDDTTKAHLLTALLGRTSTYGVMQETFARADGAVGTTSSGGQSWAANSWNITGGVAVPTATSAALLSSSALSTSSFKLKADIKFPTVSGHAHRIYALTSGSSTAKYVAVFLDGVGSFSIVCNDGTGAVTLASAGALGLTNGNMYTITVVKDGLKVWAQISGPDQATNGGPRSIVGTLTSAQEAAITGRNVLFLTVGSTADQALDNVNIGDLIKPANRLLVRNASISGTGFSYHTTNIATTIPEKPDLAVISLGHNESSTPSQFISDYQTYVAAVRSQAGSASLPIVSEIQNPRLDPNAAGLAADHAARMTALRAACPTNHWDRIDAFAAFAASPLGLAALLNVDNIHPNPLQGSPLWYQTDKARFGL